MCYNYNDLGHLTTKCRKPKAAPAKEKFSSYDKKNPYEDLKKENEKLKTKLEAMKRQQGKQKDDSDDLALPITCYNFFARNPTQHDPPNSNAGHVLGANVTRSDYD